MKDKSPEIKLRILSKIDIYNTKKIEQIMTNALNDTRLKIDSGRYKTFKIREWVLQEKFMTQSLKTTKVFQSL